MNTSVRFDFLLNSAAKNSGLQAQPQPSSEAGLQFKQQYEKQLQAPSQQANKSVSKSNTSAENNKTSSNKTAESSSHALDRNRRSDPTATQVTDKETVSGETLPMAEEARKFLAALPEEDQLQVLEEVRQWLASLSPEELQNIQEQLIKDPEQLIDLLPKELQVLLAKLQDVDLDEMQVPEGFSELVASLLNSDIDFQQLAAIQVQPGVAGDLKLVMDAQPIRSESLTARVEPSAIRTSTDKAEAPLTLSDNKSETKQEPKEQNNKSQEKLDQLVSSLGKASAQGSARSGGEALSQLLQAAGAGVAGSQAAGAATQTVARMAAGFTSMPFMMQAAAESNAQALANRISMMNSKNMQVAEMRLDPPNLGSVRVQIRMQGEQASIIFQAPNAHARELLEQSLPKLREMREDDGLMLADAQVSEESFTGQGQEQDGSNQYAGSGMAGDGDISESEQIPLLTHPLGLIHYYA